MTNLKNLFNIFHSSEYSQNISRWVTIDSINAELSPFPENLNEVLKNALMEIGITQLYSHQKEAFDLISEGKNLININWYCQWQNLLLQFVGVKCNY